MNLNDLYEAWENMSVSIIENLQVSETETTNAIKTQWITQKPKVLFFALNRIIYDTKTQSTEKICSFLKIEKTIYADRFMHENRAESEKLRMRVASEREKLKHVEQHLAEYKNF